MTEREDVTGGQPEPTHADVDAIRRMEEIRRRNAYLLSIPFEGHGPNVHGDGCPPCAMVRGISDVTTLLTLLGVGLGPEQWDAIADAEGRRYEAEQTNDTIVGYLAYGREDLKAQRHVLLREITELEAERDKARAELARRLGPVGDDG